MLQVGIHQNVCPHCQCRQSFPGVTVHESLVDDNDNGSVDDAESEMGINEN